MEEKFAFGIKMNQGTILGLKGLFVYNEKEEAEKAARIYAKKLGIPYDSEFQGPTMYSLIPQY